MKTTLTTEKRTFVLEEAQETGNLAFPRSATICFENSRTNPYSPAWQFERCVYSALSSKERYSLEDFRFLREVANFIELKLDELNKD